MGIVNGVVMDRLDLHICTIRYQQLKMSIAATGYTGINFIHNHPPCTPGDLHQKFAPTLGLLHPSFCPGRRFVGAAPEGRAFVYKQCLPFLEFSL